MVLTTKLLNDIRDNVKDELELSFTYFAVGDDDTTPIISNTILGNETFRDAIDEFDKVAVASVTASGVIEASENNGYDVNEIGWLDAASGGNLWVHELINTVSKTSDIILYLDTTIDIVVTEG